MRPRVLIVTSRHLSYNPRVVREADVLSSLGVELQVLTQWDFAAYRSFDRELMSTRHWPVEGISIEKRGAGLVRWMRTFRRQKRAQQRWSRGAVDNTTLEHAIGRTIPELARRGVSWQPTHIIGHHLEGLAAGALIAQNCNAKLFFDAEDDHLGELPPDTCPGRYNLVEAVLDLCLPLCRAWTASSSAIAAELATRHKIGEASAIIYNTHPLCEAPAPQWHGRSPLRLSWTSQTIGPGRGLVEILSALALLDRPVHVSLRGRDHLGFGAELQQLVSRSAVQLDLLPPISPAQLLADAARHHIGLTVEVGPQPNYYRNAPNKLFQALSAGMAVVYTDTPGQREVMSRTPEAGIALPRDRPDAWPMLLRDSFQPATVEAARQAAHAAAQSTWSERTTRDQLGSLWSELLELS